MTQVKGDRDLEHDSSLAMVDRHIPGINMTTHLKQADREEKIHCTDEAFWDSSKYNKWTVLHKQVESAVQVPTMSSSAIALSQEDNGEVPLALRECMQCETDHKPAGGNH